LLSSILYAAKGWIQRGLDWGKKKKKTKEKEKKKKKGRDRDLYF